MPSCSPPFRAPSLGAPCVPRCWRRTPGARVRLCRPRLRAPGRRAVPPPNRTDGRLSPLRRRVAINRLVARCTTRAERGAVAMIPQRGCPVQDVFCVEARPARGRACRKALFPGAERNRCAGGCGAGAQRVGCAMPLGYAAGIVRPHRHGAVGHSRRNGACPRHLAPARRCRFVPTRLFRPAGTAKRMRPAYRCRRGWLHKR